MGYGEMVACLLQVEDCLMVGPENKVIEWKDDMKVMFDCPDEGELYKYTWLQETYQQGGKKMTFAQPVLLQSFVDKF